MKKSDGTFDDSKMICAFSRNGFFKPSEIYSEGNIEGIKYEKYYIAHKIIIKEYSTIFRGDDIQWKNVWSYPKTWSEGVQNSDFESYNHFIGNPSYSNKYINYFMRKYMEKTVVKYPDYILYMNGYLGL